MTMICGSCRRPGVFIAVALTALVSACSACFGGFLAQDSARFSTFWTLMESGDVKVAQDSLSSMGDDGHGCSEQMVNFLYSWRAYSSGDFSGVPVFLDLGVPADLTDYALYLRADALGHSGHDLLADPYWQKLADDTASVLSADAVLRLADDSFEQGRLEDCLA